MHFDSFESEYVPKGVLSKIIDKSINKNIFRIQFDVSIMCGFYGTIFVEYMIAGKCFWITSI